MPLIIDENKEKIGLYSWWIQPDNQVFLVVGFLGFDKAETVNILLLYTNTAKEIAINKFLRLMELQLIQKINYGK